MDNSYVCMGYNDARNRVTTMALDTFLEALQNIARRYIQPWSIGNIWRISHLFIFRRCSAQIFPICSVCENVFCTLTQWVSNSGVMNLILFKIIPWSLNIQFNMRNMREIQNLYKISSKYWYDSHNDCAQRKIVCLVGRICVLSYEYEMKPFINRLSVQVNRQNIKSSPRK